jgi:hypothetical protein
MAMIHEKRHGPFGVPRADEVFPSPDPRPKPKLKPSRPLSASAIEERRKRALQVLKAARK